MRKKFKALIIMLSCIMVSVCFFACGEAQLSLGQKSVTVTVGESVTLTAESSKGGEVVWSTDKADLIFINGNQITALKEGQAKLTATADGASKTIVVTVRSAKQYVVNVDGACQTVVSGEKATRPENPQKQADGKYTYEFAGWFIKGTDTEWDFATPVTKAITLESRYEKTPVKYTVELEGIATTEYDYGCLVQKPENPQKQADAQYSYTFDGWFIKGTNTEWNFRTDMVEGELCLEPRFTETARTYTVTVNGSVAYYKYGDKVVAPSGVPVKDATAESTFEFDKWIIAGTDTAWDFATSTVEGDVEIVASYTEKDRLFSFLFMVDGVQYDKYGPLKNGTEIIAPENPQKQADGQNRYEFNGWFVQGTAIKWDFGAIDGSLIEGETVTLVANFVCTNKPLTVTLLSEGETTYKKVGYGEIVALPVPERADDQLSSYVFKQWVTEEGAAYDYSPITEDVTFVAEWTAQPKVYTVSTYVDTGKLISKINVYGGSEATRPAAPVKAATATTVYTFDKWVILGTDTEWNWATKIVEDVSVVAVFTESPRLYTVFVNGYAQSIALGGKVEKPADAVKPDDQTSSYEFVSWILADTGAEWDFENDTVNRDLNIIATFKPVPLKYYVVMDGISTVYQYGDKVIRPENPQKQSDAQYHYTFVKWVIAGRSHAWDFDRDVIEEKWLEGKTLTLVPVYDTTLRSYNVTVTYDGGIVFEDVMDYGTKLTCPVANPEKAMTESTVYTFAGWFNGETEWNFDTSVVTGETNIECVFIEEDRKYDYTLTFTTEKMTLAGLTDYTLFDVDYGVVEVTAASGGKTYTAVNGASSVVISMPKGDYTLTVKYKNATYTQGVTMDYANKSESMYLKQIADVGGKMKGYVGTTRYEYPSFQGNRTYGENSVTMTGITYVYIGEEITDKYYLEADVKLESIGMMVGFMGASSFGNLSFDNDKALQGESDRGAKRLAFSFSGGNNLYYQHDNGWGGAGITNLQGGIDTNYANVNNLTKMAVCRDGNDYFIFLNGKLITHYYTDVYGKGGFGFVNSNGGTCHVTNIRYTVKTDVVNAIVAKYDNGTYLGGSFSYPNGTRYASFGAGWSLTSHNSGTINRTSYLFVTDKVGSTYYMEAKFKDTNNWVGLLVNTLDNQPQVNKGWFGFGRYGVAGSSGRNLTTYFHKYHTRWDTGDPLGDTFFPSGDWKIGIARVNRAYYVYYNDVLWKTYGNVVAHTSANHSVELPADNPSGMGIFCGSNLDGVAQFYDVYATTDAAEVEKIMADLA